MSFQTQSLSRIQSLSVLPGHFLKKVGNILMTFGVIHSGEFFFTNIFPYQLLRKERCMTVVVISSRWVVQAKEHWIVHSLTWTPKQLQFKLQLVCLIK